VVGGWSGHGYLHFAGECGFCCGVGRSAAVGCECLSGTVQGHLQGAHLLGSEHVRDLCPGRGVRPLVARRSDLELFVRWMQETRRFKPSTVARRTSVLAGFYRTCVIDGVLDNSPAEYVRRPSVPPESPTLGLTHLQFEAMLTAAGDSANTNDFALVAMLGLLGLRIFEAIGADITDLGEEHGHHVLWVVGKRTKVVLVPLPPAVARAIDRAVATRTAGPILHDPIRDLPPRSRRNRTTIGVLERLATALTADLVVTLTPKAA